MTQPVISAAFKRRQQAQKTEQTKSVPEEAPTVVVVAKPKRTRKQQEVVD